MSKEIRAVDILNILDEEAATYNFPMPDNLNIYSAGMRLTSFRSELEWLIVFEMMNYTKNHEFVNEICAFGNKLKQQGFAFPSPIVMDALQPSSFHDLQGKFCISPWDFHVLLKKEVKHVQLQEQDYLDLGIHPKGIAPVGVSIYRYLAAS